MEADKESLSLHSSYNVAGISFDPQELAVEIKKHIPTFEIDYKPDFRQAIANSWPVSIDDSIAKADWGLNYKYGLAELTEVMLAGVRKKLEKAE